MKKSKEEADGKIKIETEKFIKFKKSTAKELDLAKKTVNDKEKVVLKLKHDLKKIDQLA